MEEADIFINGVKLTPAQSMTVRVAISSLQMSLQEGLGDDEHGRAMTSRYQKACREINSAILRNQA